jgi:hypothetical protein
MHLARHHGSKDGNMTFPARLRLHVEHLEAREVPASLVETFDTAAPPGLPAGWLRHSSDGTAGFATAAGQGTENSVGLVTSAGSLTSAVAWYGQAVGGDDTAAVSARADSLIPTFVFARGSDLDTNTPTYLAAVVTRGMRVELREVVGGAVHVLGSVTTGGYFSQQWVRVSLVPTGNSVAVQVTRADTGQYLNSQGGWQAGATAAVTATTTLPSADGFAGVGRAALYAGAVRMDDFEVIAGTPPVPPGISESFDTTAVGALPDGWGSWVGGAPGTFAAAGGTSLSPQHGLASTGGSTTAARAWAPTDLAADSTASAALYLNSIIPARVFLRGSDLDTATPTYYAANITRGLTVQLVRVVNGAETVLGSLRSADYFSSQWVRVRVTAQGDVLRVLVHRADTGEWLTPEGTWSDSPDVALEARDGAITGDGKAGVGRVASYAGSVAFDDFEARPDPVGSGPVVTIAPPAGGSTVTGDATFRAAVTGSPIRVEFRLNGVLRAVSATSPASWTLDSTTLTNGTYTLTVRAFDAAGDLGTADYTFTTSNPNAGPLAVPTVPQHYSHIRIAELAYGGNPMGTFEQNLLRNSVDLVVPNPQYLQTIQNASPDTPQLIYSNVSNLYQGLLTDWLSYADRTGADRELAFYHVTRATPFTGASSSSQPVNWFWGVYQTAPGGTPVDVTSAARGGRNFNVTLGGAGTTTAVGYTEKFREMNVTLARGAAAGWTGVWEYASAVDANGQPTAWKTLPLLRDGTQALKQTGQITFDPPADWVTASVGGSDRLYYVRLRVTAGADGQAPELQTVFGRDYVNGVPNGGTSGTIPAFDYSADRNGDGYLSDAEYANRKAGMNARFVYESRLFYPYYGQMRFVTNPSAAAVRHWAADYHTRLLAANPLADGIFMDNATGKLPFPGVSVQEPTSTYGLDSGSLMTAISRAIAPHWVMANTAGGGSDGNFVAGGAAGVFEEFALRPLQANWSAVGDLANLVSGRLAAGADYVVLDSLPTGGSPTDSRTQLATLAYYYLLADPQKTFLMFYGGSSPSTSWTQHWSPAAAVNVGAPTGQMRVFATGKDPANAALTYQVFARDYENALVLYKPLSYATGVGTGTTGNNTTTTHQLGGRYRQVRADGTLGPVVTAVALRNGEGAVFIKA